MFPLEPGAPGWGGRGVLPRGCSEPPARANGGPSSSENRCGVVCCVVLAHNRILFLTIFLCILVISTALSISTVALTIAKETCTMHLQVR